MSNRFDELCRTAAEGNPSRRQVLRMAMAVAIGVAIAPVSTAEALAKPKGQKCKAPSDCPDNQTCSTFNDATKHTCVCKAALCGGVCCDTLETCCTSQIMAGSFCVTPCPGELERDLSCDCGCGLFGQCGNTCKDFKADPANCGGCGLTCGSGQTCQDGHCVDGACPPGQSFCDSPNVMACISDNNVCCHSNLGFCTKDVTPGEGGGVCCPRLGGCASKLACDPPPAPA